MSSARKITRDYTKEAKRLGDFLQKHDWCVWDDVDDEKTCHTCNEEYESIDNYCSICGKKLTISNDSDTMKILVAAIKYATKN